jgi:prolyl-tRNA synthetase
MLFSRALIPTMKEAPADATNASHVLLSRAGYIRRVGAGIYDFLPLGYRVLRKVEAIVREEMDRAGALEILMPALLPADYFKETGRWELYGDVLLRLRDRKGGDYHLGPTHEEIVTDIARREIKSWRDLPKTLYQVQMKFRDEPRPRGGLLRGREFIMKDAYSFDADEKGAAESYEIMRQAYVRIFDRMGLDYRMVAADSGAIGGSTSAEFQVLVDSGEDAIVACENCDYAANVEAAEARSSSEAPAAPAGKPEKVETPTQRTIDEVASFLNVEKSATLKSLLYVAKDGPRAAEVVMAVVRGDHDVNEFALSRALKTSEVFLATDQDVEKFTGAKTGFAGPVGIDKGRLFVDRDAAAVKGGVAGANETGFHVKDVWFGRDYQGELLGLRLVGAGDPCPKCGGKLGAYKGIEAGHIFILGTKYSDPMKAQYIDEKQQQRNLVMGCYGIGVSRLVATTIEQHHDENGIRWPMAVAPYHVHLVTLGKDEPVLSTARALHDDLEKAGVEVLWDDRDERPGVKFKDADLIGVPLRVTIGGKGLAAGNVELKVRADADPKPSGGAAARVQGVELVPVAEAAKVVAARVAAARAIPAR